MKTVSDEELAEWIAELSARAQRAQRDEQLLSLLREVQDFRAAWPKVGPILQRAIGLATESVRDSAVEQLRAVKLAGACVCPSPN